MTAKARPPDGGARLGRLPWVLSLALLTVLLATPGQVAGSRPAGAGNDFYDVSFVDGFNLPMSVSTVGGQPDPANRFFCTTAGCSADLNPGCPGPLQKRNGSGQVVACMSACEAFGTDQFCCRNA